jgi:ElaB/YqjD/DUF883 family membrane-anchored ribosome-binding protein
MYEIPLGKALKYALQEKEALEEEFKDLVNISARQLKDLRDDFERASAAVEAAEQLLQQQEWMSTYE